MAKVAFGTYRINEYNQSHIDALVLAIQEGVELIETATHYTNGSAERAVAKALGHFDAGVLDKIEIVAKCGYIQGNLLEQYKTKETGDDVVCFKQDCYHSIAPWFIKEQVQNSLQNLEIGVIDCYMIADPEYYMYDAAKNNIAKERYQKEMSNRLFEAFVALEELVSEGKILSYGVSSQSFALPKDDEFFLDYEQLPHLAQEAALHVGKQKHSCTTVELPINIVEKYGLNCSFWAKEQNIRILSNRTLTAIYQSQPYRLAEYDEPRDYYMYLNELMEFCDNDLLKPIYNLVGTMDETKHRFLYVGEYDAFVHSQVLPHVKTSLQKLDGATQDKLLFHIEMFLESYRQMVLSECGNKTKKALSVYFKYCNTTLQECAIEYMLKQESVDYALVGARKISYVTQMVELEKNS